MKLVKSTMQETIYSLYCHRPCKWVNISEIKGVILEVTKSAVVLLCTRFIGIRHNHRGKYYSTGLNKGFSLRFIRKTEQPDLLTEIAWGTEKSTCLFMRYSRRFLLQL